MTDDKSEFTYSWRQGLPIVASSDRHIIENLYVCDRLRGSAVNLRAFPVKLSSSHRLPVGSEVGGALRSTLRREPQLEVGGKKNFL